MEKYVIDQQFLMDPDEALIPSSEGLGCYVMGLRDLCKKPKWTLTDTILTAIAVAAIVVAVTTASIITKVAAMTVALLCLIIPFLINLWMVIHYYTNRDYVFFFEEGFIWQKRRPNGKVVDIRQVRYGDVDHIEAKERSIKSGDENNDNPGYRYTLSLVGCDGAILFKETGSYRQNSLYLQRKGAPPVSHTVRSAAIKTIEHYLSAESA